MAIAQPNARPKPRGARRRARAGFTIIELLMVMVVIGLLAQIGSQKYGAYLVRARVAKAIGDIKAIQTDIDSFEAENNRLPNNLAEIGRSTLMDPFGNSYVYEAFPGGVPSGSARTDRLGVAVNTKYDLYCKGFDGSTATSLTAASSRDDVTRANDGGFIGSGSLF
jgi:general secretion pathway protein G